jgi:NAD(P)-dependent dehydrogenase (short-subunit alcohol dehydrogenase family)
MRSFKNKVAAITGAASGIGRSLAVALAKRGCDLALSDVNDAGLAESAALALARGVKVTTARVDVARSAEVHAWADAVVRDHGKVNLVFNNAGVGLGATIEGSTYTDLEWIVGVNFWGVVYGTKAFLPHLKTSGDGHVINMSSLFGLVATPGNGAYNATKFAVRGFTETLREELEMTGAPVSATSVHPGGIKTNIARAARTHPSLHDLGIEDLERGRENFEKSFRTTSDEAAEIILRGVKRNARRVLVGNDARILDVVQRLLPSAYQSIVTLYARRTVR